MAEHGGGRRVVRTPLELVSAVKARTFNLAVQFSDELEGFDWACRTAYAAGDLMFVVDEVDFYIKAGFAPKPFSKLVRYGRHKGVAMMCISRRPPDLWRNLTANTDNIYSFFMHEPRDLKYLADFMGDENAQKLKTLGKLEYMHYRNGEVRRGKTRF